MKKLVLILIATLSMIVAQSAYADEEADSIGLSGGTFFGPVSDQLCAASCDTFNLCKMAYYITDGPKRGNCYFSRNSKPNAKLKAKYGIFSKKASKWLSKADIVAQKSNEAGKIKSASVKKSRKKTFKDPQIETGYGFRLLNVCNKPGGKRNCGKFAAEKFCKKKGYSDVLKYRKNSYISGNTAHISNGKICDDLDYDCVGFESITCYNYF